MKTCRQCGETKPLDDFYTMAGMRDGHRNECKACSLAAKARRHRDNPEPARERARRWRNANPSKYAALRARQRANGSKARSDRKFHLKRNYGLTLEEYDEMFATQGGVCAICGRAPTAGISLHVDHNHKTGKHRSLTCFRCNNALGDFNDDPELVQKAALYLAQHADPHHDETVALIRSRAAALRPSTLF